MCKICGEEDCGTERTLRQLKLSLQEIERADQSQHYDYRNWQVYQAVYLAISIGFRAGFRFDPAEPHWPVAFIELPTGQVSWHLPEHDIPWDGHSTELKYFRCREFQDYRGAM